jgi:DNA-binding response OmpR family regulator
MIFRRKNIKVVIVDDDPIFSSVLVKCLRKKGMNDIEVFDSAVPLLNRDNWSPDLIFMDFKMSDLNGARAARSIKRKKSSSVIILMSSSERVERVKRHKFKIDRIAHKEIGVLRIAEAGIRTYSVASFKRMSLQFMIWLVLLALLSTVLYQFL